MELADLNWPEPGQTGALSGRKPGPRRVWRDSKAAALALAEFLMIRNGYAGRTFLISAHDPWDITPSDPFQ